MQSTSHPNHKPKLLESLRREIRIRQYSIRTERAYTDWVRRYCHFHKLKHPDTIGAKEITAFLSYLAAEENVAASTHRVNSSSARGYRTVFASAYKGNGNSQQCTMFTFYILKKTTESILDIQPVWS